MTERVGEAGTTGPEESGPTRAAPDGSQTADETVRDGADDRPSMPRIVLAGTVNAGQRLHLLSDPAPPAVNVTVGLLAQGAQAGERLIGQCSDGVRKVAGLPAPWLRQVIANAAERGEDAIAGSSRQTAAWLRGPVSDTVAKSTRSLLGGLVSRAVRQAAETLSPVVIDAVLPYIREQAVPALVGDVVADQRLRAMVAAQGRSVMASMADELQAKIASADDRAEAAFQRLRRGGPAT
ncbi:hypothetical protein FXF51_03370 [Nonomuraea sp. PA05]|uniref:hypothetical protein n=1 Tax=Nonomuraea sp. PA05 TaxID=2604466 RepID=UPI0011D3B3F2|nr:hypothetical protein [Nonomuraea sp. PA05]TYB70134.1 hypothetical protein FXF51_03370 [Nonomuraea sp. PA05]